MENKETIQDFIKSIYPSPNGAKIKGIELGAKWQQERSYSEEDMKNAFTQGFNARYKMQDGVESRNAFMEQFKKK